MKNNKPLAWITQKALDDLRIPLISEITLRIAVKSKNTDPFNIPLYTNPVKELTDEEIIKTANSLGLIHAYDTEGQWSGITNEPLFDSEKQRNNERLLEILKPFTDEILRKAQEK